MTVTLLWVDYDEWTAGWIEQSGERRTRREGEGEKRGRKLGIHRITPTFHLPSGRQQLKGITSVSFNPFFLLRGYRKVKPSKNSDCISCVVVSCVCACACTCICWLVCANYMHNDFH